MNNHQDAERHVNEINTNAFFKEFTYGINLLIKDGNHESELADNVVWLDDIFIIYQIKERSATEKSAEFEKWFNNAIRKKAAKQIKYTLKALELRNDVVVSNNRGHMKNLKEAPLNQVKKVIIYNPNEEVSEEIRFQKFHVSSEAGLIHLFHLEDYLYVCKFLFTPVEIEDYLWFRETIYNNFPDQVSALPEQYLLGHFLSENDVDHIDPTYIKNVITFQNDVNTFDLSGYLLSFGDKIKLVNESDDYYVILKELAKLHRDELRFIKQRFMKSLEICKDNDLHDPFRVTLPRVKCGYVFVPLPKELSKHWKNAVTNIALAHKYEQRLDKCIGVALYEDGEDFEIFWVYIEESWIYNSEAEELVKKLPLREVKIKKMDGYKFNEDKKN